MSAPRLRVACVQLRSGEDAAANVATATRLIRDAHAAGATFIATPENTAMMSADGGAKLALSFAEKDDPALPAFTALARELGIWLLIGSLAIKVSETKTANRSFLIGPDGAIAARYDKIHMFDVEIPDGQSYRESRAYQAGARAVTADLPWGRLGMTVCYDMRFPYLYRALAKTGADFLSVPSAFTRFTGESHWHVLLRARAIETGCFVLARAAGCANAPDPRSW